jgi:hypothetical protein
VSENAEIVWVPKSFLASGRVRSYHWDPSCPRAPERAELIEVALPAVLASPRLKACPACDPSRFEVSHRLPGL